MELRRSLAHYHDQLVVHGTSYHLAPEVFARNGAVAVAALILVPLAALAWGRRWPPFVLGGSLAVLAMMLVPFLFEHLSDAVSLSQSRRAAGFLPFAFAFAGGVAVLSRLLAIFVLPIALLAGTVFQILWPGDFGFRLVNGGPEHAAWFAAVAGLLVPRRRPRRATPARARRDDWLPALAVGLFVLPVAVHGFARWSTSTTATPMRSRPGLVEALREDVPKRGVVFSDLQTSYRSPQQRRCSSLPPHRSTLRTRSRTGRTSAAATSRPTSPRGSRDPRALPRALARHRALHAAPERPAAAAIQGRALCSLQALTREVLIVTLYFPPRAAAACNGR
jgi:hypothetical protein